MARDISIEKFSEMIADRDVRVLCNNALVEVERYYGRDIHKMPQVRRSLTVMLTWASNGWLGEARTFREAQEQHPVEVKGLVINLYNGFVSELYAI